MDKAQRGREEQEGSCIGGWDQAVVPGAGSKLGRSVRRRWPGTGQPISKATPSHFRGGGLSSFPTLIVTDLWTAMAWTIGINGRVIGVSR